MTHRDLKPGTPERLIQRLEDAASGGLYICIADREEAVEIAAEEMAAALSAPSPAAGATGAVPPAGWRLAPVEPTIEMLAAYWQQTGESHEMRPRIEAYAKQYYAAMLAAAPESPTPVTSALGAERCGYTECAALGRTVCEDCRPLVGTSAPGAEGEPVAVEKLSSELALKIRDAEWHEYGRLQLSDFVVENKSLFARLLNKDAKPDAWMYKSNSALGLQTVASVHKPPESPHYTIEPLFKHPPAPAAPRSADLPGREEIQKAHAAAIRHTDWWKIPEDRWLQIFSEYLPAFVAALLAPTSPTQEMRAAGGDGWSADMEAGKREPEVDLFLVEWTSPRRVTQYFWDPEQRGGGEWVRLADKNKDWRDRQMMPSTFVTHWRKPPPPPAAAPAT